MESFALWAKTLNEANRLETFRGNWKFKTGKCSAINMARAGWYREPNWGVDEVRCFVCFKELDGWQKDDDPWEEHKKHSPNCEFVKQGGCDAPMTLRKLLLLQRARIENHFVSLILKKDVLFMCIDSLINT